MHTQITQLQRLIDDVESITDIEGAPTPGAFLASVMSGHDPRPGFDSVLYTMVKKIAFREFETGTAMPTQDEWKLIQHMILDSDVYRRAPVDVEQSQKAAEKLMEYLHAKMKSVEVTGDLDVNVKITPLTDEAAEIFKDKFNDEF